MGSALGTRQTIHYDNGKLYDTIDDVMERRPIPSSQQPEKMMTIRKKLQAALDAYPASGRGIDLERVKASRN